MLCRMIQKFTFSIYQDIVGYDGGKKIKDRKRHIIVDTLGLIHANEMHSAATHDSKFC
jgi:hypothetical protein